MDEALKSADSSDDITSMIQARNNLTLLASVRKGTGNPAEGIEALLRALELQNKIIVKLRSLNPGTCTCSRCGEGREAGRGAPNDNCC